MPPKLELWTLCVGLEIKMFKQRDKEDILVFFFYTLYTQCNSSHIGKSGFVSYPL